MASILSLISKKCPECGFKGAKKDIWGHIQREHGLLAHKLKRRSAKLQVEAYKKRMKAEGREEEPYKSSAERVELTLKEDIAIIRKKDEPIICPKCDSVVTDLGVGYGEYYAKDPEGREYKLGYDESGCGRAVYIHEED